MLVLRAEVVQNEAPGPVFKKRHAPPARKVTCRQFFFPSPPTDDVCPLLQVLYRQNWHAVTTVRETNKTSVELHIPSGEDYLIEIKALTEGGDGTSSGPVRIPKMSSKCETLCGVHMTRFPTNSIPSVVIYNRNTPGCMCVQDKLHTGEKIDLNLHLTGGNGTQSSFGLSGDLKHTVCQNHLSFVK